MTMQQSSITSTNLQGHSNDPTEMDPSCATSAAKRRRRRRRRRRGGQKSAGWRSPENPDEPWWWSLSPRPVDSDGNILPPGVEGLPVTLPSGQNVYITRESMNAAYARTFLPSSFYQIDEGTPKNGNGVDEIHCPCEDDYDDNIPLMAETETKSLSSLSSAFSDTSAEWASETLSVSSMSSTSQSTYCEWDCFSHTAMDLHLESVLPTDLKLRTGGWCEDSQFDDETERNLSDDTWSCKLLSSHQIISDEFSNIRPPDSVFEFDFLPDDLSSEMAFRQDVDERQGSFIDSLLSDDNCCNFDKSCSTTFTDEVYSVSSESSGPSSIPKLRLSKNMRRVQRRAQENKDKELAALAVRQRQHERRRRRNEAKKHRRETRVDFSSDVNDVHEIDCALEQIRI